MKITAHVSDSGYPVPIVEVTMAYDGAVIETEAIVDSGAEATVWPAELLPPRVVWDSLPRYTDELAQGPGGVFELRRLEPVSLAWRGTEFTRSIAVAAPRDDGRRVHPFLGLPDFFTTFTVTLELHKVPPVFHVKAPPGTRQS